MFRQYLCITILAMVISLYFSGLTQAQYPVLRFEHVSTEDGLSDEDVTAIMQDNRGFMWFGTQDGLNRYDGYEIITFKFDPDNFHSLSNNWITTLHQDTSGMIWIGTKDGGLNTFDPITEKFTRYQDNPDNPNSFDVSTIYDIYQDTDEIIWFATNKGLTAMSLSNPININHFSIDDYDADITAMIEDHLGMFWLATKKGVFTFDRQTETFMLTKIKDSDASMMNMREVKSICEDSNNIIRVSMSSGYFMRFDRKTNTFTSFTNGEYGSTISTAYEDSNGTLWLGSLKDGLGKFDIDTEEIITNYEHDPTNSTSLSDNAVTAIYEDRGGILWVGTREGVNKFNPATTAFNHYRYIPGKPSLNRGSVLSIYEDSKGMVWIGTDQGLSRFDHDNLKFTLFINKLNEPTTLSQNLVSAIYEDKSNTLWIGTGHGLNKFDSETETFTAYYHDPENPNSLSNDSITAIYEDNKGMLWLGTIAGLNKFDRSSETFTRYLHDPDNDESLSDDRVTVIYKDSNDSLWIGTENGLNEFDLEDNDIIRYQHNSKNPASLSNNHITSIYEDDDEYVWIGTQGGGLNKCMRLGNIFIHYRQKDGLASDTVYGILGGGHGNLWLSSDKGLTNFNLEEGTYETYHAVDGLQGDEFYAGAYHQNERGKLFFGGVNGFNMFHPDEIEKNMHAPETALLVFKSLNQDEKWDFFSTFPTDNLIIHHGSHFVHFTFVGLDYANSAENQYQYKLEGRDSKWMDVEGEGRGASFASLDGGQYIFHVRASNNDGMWNEEGLAIPFTVTTPFYKTWFAYGLYLMMAMGLAYGLHRMRLHKQETELKRERVVANRLRQLDKLKDEFLANTSHELRTPINGMVGIAESLIDGATGELQQETVVNLRMIMTSGWRLTNLVNDLLDFSKLKHKNLELSMRPIGLRSLTNVVLSLSKPLVARRNIELINNINPETPFVMADENRTQQIMYNLVGNAIKFTQEGRIEISAEVVDNAGNKFVAVTVSDTGIGIPEDRLDRIFESFEQVDGSIERKYGGTGIGLTITKQLVELHGGDVSATSQVGEGSQFTFTLPLTQIEEHKSLSSDMPDETNGHDVPAKNIIPLNDITDIHHHSEEISDKLSVSPSVSGMINVLVVDDEPVNLQVLINYLSTHNYNITQATDGPDALDAVENGKKFDIILLDIMMPRMSGYEVCRRIREMYPSHETPILMLTAKNQVTDLVEAFSVGANDYLIKPISKHELLARIQTHIRLAKINIAYERFVPYEFLRFLKKESIVDVKLGDHVSKEMAVMFSDIRGFTTLSESMTPQENFDFVNSYLREVSPTIRDNSGFIVKYLGDGMMAIFPDGADSAIQAGIAKWEHDVWHGRRGRTHARGCLFG